MSKRSSPSAPSAGASKRRFVQTHKSATELAAGMRGVMITCDSHLERKAIRECFELFGSLVEGTEDAGPQEGAVAVAGGTAGDALARELGELKQSMRGARRPTFSVAQTGCAGNVMIRFDAGATLDPVELVERAMEEALRARRSGAPHVVRMLPVQASCSAHTKNIVQIVAPLVKAALKGSEASFAVQWRRRHNTSLEKMDVINAVAEAVLSVAPKARVDLSDPEVSVSIEVVKNVCCVAVLTQWQRFKEYNLRALQPPSPEPAAEDISRQAEGASHSAESTSS